MTTKKTDDTAESTDTYAEWREARIAAAAQAEKDAQKAADKAATA